MKKARDLLFQFTWTFLLTLLWWNIYFYYFPSKPKDDTSLLAGAVEVSAMTQLKNLAQSQTATTAPTTQNDIILENEDVCITFNPQGGLIRGVVLKKYKHWDQGPLVLLDQETSSMSMLLPTEKGLTNTKDFLFTVEQKNKHEVVFTYILDASKEQSVTYTYTLPKQGYELSYGVQANGFDTGKKAQFVWYNQLKKLEKDTAMSRRYSYLQYYGSNRKLGYLNATAQKEIDTPIAWVSNKQRFFTKGIVAPTGSPFSQIKCVTQKVPKGEDTVLMKTATQMHIPVENLHASKGGFTFYFGPNQYETLQRVAPGFEKNLYLGYPIIRSVNRYIILPLTDFLNEYTDSYVWAIILFIILLKLLLLYFAYRSYITGIKKKALRPIVEAMKAQYPDPDDKDKQTIQMAEMRLYTKMGVSPFSLTGIVVAFLQLPFFMAMLYFIPTALELRQTSFLWVSDLAGYDDLIRFPFYVPLLGNHISLLALFMTLSSFLPGWLKKTEPVSGHMQTLGYAMYIMPIGFFFAFNSYAAAFCLYRLVSNLVDMLPPLIFRYLIDEAPYIAEMEAKYASMPMVTDERPRALARLDKKRKKRRK